MCSCVSVTASAWARSFDFRSTIVTSSVSIRRTRSMRPATDTPSPSEISIAFSENSRFLNSARVLADVGVDYSPRGLLQLLAQRRVGVRRA